MGVLAWMQPATFKAIRNILANCDKHSEQMFLHFKDEFTRELPKYKSADEYFNRLNSRTDVSQDDKWELGLFGICC